MGRRRRHAGVRRLRFGQRAAAAGEIGRRHEVVPAVVDAGQAAANLGRNPEFQARSRSESPALAS